MSSVWSLDYPFTVALAVGAARLVSTPSELLRLGSGLASALAKAFPEFEQFYFRRFHRSTQAISPLRLPIPPREHVFNLLQARDRRLLLLQ